MSDTSFVEKILPWFHTPETYNTDYEENFKERDNIWSDFHLFDNNWVEIQNRMDWYESPNIPKIYRNHKYIFKQNMGFPRPDESFYQQNVDSNAFKSIITAQENLPSDKGELRIITTIDANAPSGENDFAFVDYFVETEIKYNMPGGVTFLPRILAYPLNKIFKKLFIKYIGEELIEYDSEYAIERTREYFQYLRKYHGEEPIQTKSRQAEFKPVPEEGIFFQ